MLLGSGRKFDIVPVEFRYFFSGLVTCVVTEQVHDRVPVRDKINIGPEPHGKNILCPVTITGCDVLQLCCSHLVYPDVIGLSSFVVFPGSEFPEHAVQSQVFPVRRKRAKTSFARRYLSQFASFCRNRKKMGAHS